MNQLKPFMFWIVIGAILFCELLWWVLSIPDIDLVGNKASAQKMQASLKEEYNHLKELDRRAKNTSPLGVFDAEKPDDIKRLTDEYLITPAWKEVLDPHVAGYDKQLKAIKERLAARSKHLHEPIAASNDKFGWYTAYQNASEQQLKKLNAVGGLVLKSTADGQRIRAPLGGMPTGAPGGLSAGRPSGNPAATVDDSDAVKTLDFANDSALRSQAGFYTKGADLPGAEEYPLLTRQFRTMERIISILTETTAANVVNPLVAVAETPTPAHAAILSVTWDATEVALGGDTGANAEGWRLSLVLQGSMSALLATTAALEHAHGDNLPLMIVTGGELARKTQFAPGERKDAGGEIATTRVDVLVLDFTNAPAALKANATPTPRPGNPGANFMGGIGMPPGGMPPGMRPPGQAPNQARPDSAPSTNNEDNP